jgi:hypothetical protein
LPNYVAPRGGREGAFIFDAKKIEIQAFSLIIVFVIVRQDMDMHIDVDSDWRIQVYELVNLIGTTYQSLMEGSGNELT